MTKLTEEHHVARKWVDEHYPTVFGPMRTALILAFGAGMDRGFAECEEFIAELQKMVTWTDA